MVVVPPLRREKDYILKKLNLIVPRLGDGGVFDITSHFAMISYEEDIFTGAIHGSIVMKDAVDYPTLIPLIGEEKIKFVFTRQDEKITDKGVELPPIEFEGTIYAMKDREIQTTSNKIQAYTLYFTSDVVVNNFRSKVSKSWKDKLTSEMITQIYDEYLSTGKELLVEETKYLQNYIATSKKPFNIIKELSKRSISAEETGTFYVFYEDRDNFHFTTIGSLLDKEPVKTIRHEIRNISKDGQQQFDRFIDTVTNYHQATSFDFVQQISSGAQSSRLLMVDPLRRKFEFKDFDLDSEWDSFKHADPAKPFTSDESSNKQLKVPQASISMIVSDKEQDTVDHLVSKDDSIKPFKLDEAIQLRDSQAEQVKKNIISVSVPGDPRFKAGDTIDFKLPEILGKTSEDYPEELDKFISGKYLIVSVAHIVMENQYTVNMELVKDSFVNDIFHRNPVEEYKGIY